MTSRSREEIRRAIDAGPASEEWKALIRDLGVLANQVAREYDEHMVAIAEERAALRDVIFVLLAASFKKRRQRLEFLESLCEELADQMCEELEKKS